MGALPGRLETDHGGRHRHVERLRWIVHRHGDAAVEMRVEIGREAVSLVAERLSAQGAVSYRRGRFRVLDRRRIEEQACECYAKIREEYDELLS